MLFWFSLLVALVSGLLAIGFSREAVKLRFPIIGDYHLDGVAAILLVCGLIISAVEHSRARALQQRAETSLRQLSTFATEQRTVNFDRASGILQEGPKGSVEIAPLQGNVEANSLADQLQIVFSKSGWKVSRREAGTNEIVTAGIAVVTGARSDGTSGGDGLLQLDEPAKTLRIVLTTCITDNGRGGSFRTNSRIARDAALILIGPKY